MNDMPNRLDPLVGTEREPEVSKWMASLTSSINVLDAELAKLIDRLSVVLSSAPHEETVPNEVSQLCVLATAIRDQHQRVVRLTDIVRSIVSRLEV